MHYPTGIFIDGAGDLYIADEGNHRIRRVEGIAAPSGLEVGTFAPVITPDTKSGDFNEDGQLSFPDFILFAQNFGRTKGDRDFNAKYDLDDSGSVDFADFLQFAQAFGNPVVSG